MRYQLDPGIEIYVRRVDDQNRVVFDDLSLWETHATEKLTIISNSEVYDKVTLAKYNRYKNVAADVVVHSDWMIKFINKGYAIIERDGWYVVVPREILLGNI